MSAHNQSRSLTDLLRQMGTPEARFTRGPSPSIWSTSVKAKRRQSLIASQLRIASENKESDEHAYWEQMRIQDEIDEMDDRNRECDEMVKYWEREGEKNERNKRNKKMAEYLERAQA
jgi:hypothetical protein